MRNTLIALVVLSAASSASAARYSLDDFGSLDTVTSPAYAPAGDRIAYVFGGDLHLVDATGAVTLVKEGASNPRWRNGNLYFDASGGSDNDGDARTTQLWRLSATNTQPEQLSRLEHGAGNAVLSPDGARALLVRSAAQLDPATEPEPMVVTRRQFKRDEGAGYITDRDTRHLYLLDIDPGTLTPMTAGPHDATQPAWLPDGSGIVFVSNRNPKLGEDYRTDLWLMDLETGSTTALTDSTSAKHAPRVHPDGRTVTWIDSTDGVYSLQRLMSAPVSGGKAQLQSPIDRWVNGFAYNPRGSHIYFTFENEGASALARLRLQDGMLDTLIDGPDTVSEFDVGPDRLALVMARTGKVSELYRHDGKLTRLTHNAHLDARVLGRRYLDSYTVDGVEIQTFVTLPPDHQPGERHPTVLHIHGGPMGQFTWGHDTIAQLLAAHGYVVLQPNPRGSTGRGQAFVAAVAGDWADPAYDDLIGAVDHAIAEGFADPKRLAVTGFSYGGYMTNVIVTRTQRFGAAASGAGHSMLSANFGHDIYQAWYVWELGTPWTNQAAYDDLSPFLQAEQVVTPTLVLGGQLDWNVPILNSELFYQALRVRGVETQLVVYPDTHHGGWSTAFDRDYWQRTLNWFDEHLN